MISVAATLWPVFTVHRCIQCAQERAGSALQISYRPFEALHSKSTLESSIFGVRLGDSTKDTRAHGVHSQMQMFRLLRLIAYFQTFF